MKKILTVLLVAGIMIFGSCINSTQKVEVKKDSTADSSIIDVVKKEEIKADSIKREKIKADSIFLAIHYILKTRLMPINKMR